MSATRSQGGLTTTIISDCTDVAFVEMRRSIQRGYAAAGGIGSVLSSIEPLVGCTPFSVTHASFLLRLLADAAGPHDVIMVIVNPIAERTQRLLARTSSGVIVEGTNTGALGWTLRELGCDACIELHDPGFLPFGGKEVHAPSVGALLAGRSLEQLGTDFPVERVRGSRPRIGEVLHIDNFGNLKICATPMEIPGFEEGHEITIKLSDGTAANARCHRRMMDLEDGCLVVYPGSSLGLLEIGRVRTAGPALPVHLGDIVSFHVDDV